MPTGRPWGHPIPPDALIVDVAGDDADLAAAATAAEDAVVRFAPSAGSDLARAVGLGPGGGGTGETVVPVDLLDLGYGRCAANAVVLGPAPDRLRPWHRLRHVTVEVEGRPVFDEPATTVVVASGQFLRGADLVPRGHPGDGRLEVQVYALKPGERPGMRRRLGRGDHVPHPRILELSGKRVDVHWRDGEQPVEVDGHPLATAGNLGIVIRPGAARLLV